MNFFKHASDGWEIASRSFKSLEGNKKLIVFPLTSGISLFLISAPFVVSLFEEAAWNTEKNISPIYYLYALAFYLLNYLVIVFFNTSLTFCAQQYFKGQKVSIKGGIIFSIAHFFTIFSWGIFAATVGAILRIIQSNVGMAAQIIAGFAINLFGVATYFVLPILVFEKLAPVNAFKRSVQVLKDMWGKTVGAAFNFLFIQFIAMVFISIIAITVGTIFNVLAGILLALFGLLVLLTAISAARIIFMMAVYSQLKGHTIAGFDKEFIDKLFISRTKKAVSKEL